MNRHFMDKILYTFFALCVILAVICSFIKIWNMSCRYLLKSSIMAENIQQESECSKRPNEYDLPSIRIHEIPNSKRFISSV